MRGNAGQIGNNFVGMKVRIGKRFYVVIEQIEGVPYDKHFVLKDLENDKEVCCGRDKFTIPRVK